MPEEVTEAMVRAFFLSFNVAGETWIKATNRDRVRRALSAALDAAPSGHGERG